MTLFEIIRDLESFDNQGVICARKPWTETSDAAVVIELDVRRLPAKAEELGMNYFLEVFVAREVLEGWTANIDAEPTPHQKRARIIQYAINDG